MVAVKDGICTGRNGTVEIKGVQVSSFGDLIRLDCVSRARGTVLNTGFSMDLEEAKAVAEEVLRQVLDQEFEKSFPTTPKLGVTKDTDE